MSLIQEFQNLRHYSLHMFTGELKDFVLSAEFEENMRKADADPEILARLNMRALKGITLESFRGTRPDDFILRSETHTTYLIGFSRVVNPMGPMLTLPNDSDYVDEMTRAVEENLNSKMFKAAKMSRRMDKRAVRLASQSAARGRKAYDLVLKQSNYYSKESSPEERYHQIFLANLAYDQVTDPARARIKERHRRVSDCVDPGFTGNYSEAIANFFHKHLASCVANTEYTERPSEEKALAAIESFLQGQMGMVSPFQMVPDGDETCGNKCGWAFCVLSSDTTSYVHADIDIEWYGTAYDENLCLHDDDSCSPAMG